MVAGNSAVALGAAKALAKRSVNVAVAGWSQAGGETAVKEIAAAGGVAQFIGTDVSRTLDIRRLASRVESDLGRATILVNAAETLGLRAPLMELYEDEFDDLVAVNLRSAFLLARTFVPGMIQAGGGHIVNVVAAGSAPAGAGGYLSSRAGLRPLTVHLAEELRAHSIRVNGLDGGDVRGYLEPTGSRSPGDIPDAPDRPMPPKRRIDDVVKAIVELCECPPEFTGRILEPGA